MTRSRLLVAASVAFLLGLLPTPLWACSCFGFATFQQVTREPGMVVLVGTVIATGGDSGETVSPADPPHVDVDVSWVAKGNASSTRVRIWNLWAGTSCGGSLSNLTPGTTAAFAARTAALAKRDFTELWEVLNANIPPTDYVVTTTCGQAVHVLRTRKELDQYVGRRVP